MCFLSLLLSLISAFGHSAPAVVATVNGEAITAEELQLQMQNSEGETLSRDEALDRLILFRLAVQKAKKDKLENNAAVKREMNKTLYKAFLDKELTAKESSLDPSPAELQAAYDKAPLFTLRHLVFLNETSQDRKRLDEELPVVMKRLESGTDFKTLVIEFSQDPMGKQGGELEFRGQHNLPPALYAEALKLSPGKVSPPIALKNSVHLIEVLKKTEYAAIPASYLEFLRHKLKHDRSERFLSDLLNRLKQDAKIQLASQGKSAK